MDGRTYIATKVLKMKILDAHTHIDYITHEHQTNVVGCICCATAEDDWQKIINLMTRDNGVYGAFGVHPWFINSFNNGLIKRLSDLLETDANYMVGEIGLDKYKPDMEKQIDVFMAQFDVAIKLKRSVFLHCVGAWDKFFHVLKQYKESDLPTIVIHGFNSNENILTRLLQYKNIYFSLSKNYVYGRNNRIEQIPSNRILVETDGKKEVVLSNLIDKISDIKNEFYICDIIYNNTQKVLKNG